MNKIRKVIHYLAHDRDKFKLAILVRLARLYRSDEKYLKKLFRLKMGKELNLDNPQTFSEKLQWLKLNNRKPEYTQMVDKVEVKKYVADIIGEEYIIPTLGVYNSVDEIDFDALPNQFVLKTTHGGGGGGVVVCKDKATLNIAECKRKLQRSMKQNIYWHLREWPYKDVKPRIIAEKLLEVKECEDLPDYKFYCFNGEPTYCQVIHDRNAKETIDFYDMEWNHMPFVGLNPVAENGLTPVDKPAHLANMIEICKQLAKDIPFSRVDLYVVNNSEYFGEITFYPASGLGEFRPEEWNGKLGKLVDIQGFTPPHEATKYKCMIINGSINIEQYDFKASSLNDYKFFCFNGRPKCCQVIGGRESVMTVDFFDKEWNHLPFHEPKVYPFSQEEVSKPQSFETMWSLAEKLSANQSFLRVDFYDVNGQIYFGELTFFPTSGMGCFDPEEWDYTFGSWIKLPKA